MLNRELILRGGSKLEATRLFLEQRLDIPIPQSAFLYAGQSLDSVRTEFEGMKKPVIVRGSNKGDWHGMIGVVPTTRDVYIWSELEAAIRKHEKFMKKEEVKDYAKDEGTPYTEEVHHLIQEQASKIVGILMRHPNQPDKLIIKYVNPNDYRPDLWSRTAFVGDAEYTAQNGLSRTIVPQMPENAKVTNKDLIQIVEMFTSIEESGLIEHGWAYQLEFGIHPMMFFQIRPFKPIQQSDFRIDLEEYGDPHIYLPDVFGITSKDGIELPFVAMTGWNLSGSTHKNPLWNVENPYGLMYDSKLDDELPIRMPFGKLQVILTGGSGITLFHGPYRLMKRASISGGGYASYSKYEGGRLITDMTLGDNLVGSLHDFKGPARIVSDGYSGVLTSKFFTF